MKKVSIGSVVSGGLWLWYDHMASMALANLLWVGMSLGVVTIPMATAGLCYYVYSLFSGRDESLKSFFVGIRKLWWRASLLGAGCLLVILMAGVNVGFYLFKASDWSKLLGMVGAGIFFWVSILAMSLTLYLFPLLCHYERGAKRILKSALLLAIANPWLLLFLFVSSLVMAGAGTVSGIGALFVMAALSFTLSTVAVVEGLVLYGAVDPESMVARKLEGFKADWSKRTLRYLIKPWE